MGRPAGQQGALSTAALSFAEQLRVARQPHRRMPRSDWSPVEAAVHVLQLLRIFALLADGGTSPYTRHEEFPRISEELIAAESERDPAALAKTLEEATAQWVAAAGERSQTDPFDWHGIVTITLAEAAGILLGEFLLHGRDIARAEGRPWMMTYEDARTVLTSILPLLPHVVDQEQTAGIRASYGIRINTTA